MRGRNEKSIRIARRVRVNQTDAETVLWNRIRNRQIDGYKFVRQVPMLGYICDFVCREQRLIIRSGWRWLKTVIACFYSGTTMFLEISKAS